MNHRLGWVGVLACIISFASTGPASATYYWASTSGSNTAACGDIDSTALDEDPGVYGTIGQAARCITSAGGIVVVKAGTYTASTHVINTAGAGNIDPGQFVSGTSDPTRTVVMGDPSGARPLIRMTNSFYCTYATTERHWVTLKYLEIDQQGGVGCGGGIFITGQHVTLDDIVLYNTGGSGVYFNSGGGGPIDTSRSAFGLIKNSVIHDVRLAGTNGYCAYIQSTDITVEDAECYHAKGWGWHVYNGTDPATAPDRSIIRRTYVHDIISGTTSFCGAAVLYGTGHKVYDNRFEISPITCVAATSPQATISTQLAGSIEIYNNIIINPRGPGIHIGANQTATIKNNVLWDISGTAISGGTGATLIRTHNACDAADVAASCGTNAQTLTALTDCFISTSDLRLKQGTNICRNNGTSVPTRPAPVGGTDIGAYEQGEVAAAAVVSGFIEITTNIMTPGLVPSTGITGVTIACVGCTGSPVASADNVKSGSSNVMQITVTGILSSGTCTVSLGTTNATDSLYIGGLAQGLNTASGVSVSGTCVNTGGASPGGGLWSHFPLDEGSGTVANDDSGAAHHGTVSAGVTWVNDVSGTGVTIPADTTYRQVSSTYGSGVDPTTQDFTACVYGRADTTQSQKIVLSSATLGSNQRWYAGFATVGGQKQWGVGAQASGFFTGSEFVATDNMTLICLISDATADTVTLNINGVMGALAGQSVKTVPSYMLTGNIISGNDGTFTTNTGGFTVYEMWVWDNKQSAADILTLYNSLTPTGTTPCLAQSHRQFEAVYTTVGGSPIALTPKADGSIDVVKNGGVAVRIQYTCTGGAGSAVALQAFYSTNNVNFDLPVPAIVGAAGIAMWGEDLNPYFNDGASTGCIDATGLTANSGITVLGATAGPTFTLAQNHCRSDRYIFRFGMIEGPVWVQMKTDSGRTFANGYTQAIKFNVIPSQANMGL